MDPRRSSGLHFAVHTIWTAPTLLTLLPNLNPVYSGLLFYQVVCLCLQSDGYGSEDLSGAEGAHRGEGKCWIFIIDFGG